MTLAHLYQNDLSYDEDVELQNENAIQVWMSDCNDNRMYCGVVSINYVGDDEVWRDKPYLSKDITGEYKEFSTIYEAIGHIRAVTARYMSTVEYVSW